MRGFSGGSLTGARFLLEFRLAIAITSKQRRAMETEADRTRTFTRRTMLLAGGGAALGIVLTGRVGYLAVLESPKYKLLAEENRVSLRMIPPRRGVIVDRFGVPLAVNRPDYRLALIPEQVEDLDRTLAQIGRFLPLTPADIAKAKRDFERLPGYMPVEVARDLDWSAFSALNVRMVDLAGLQPVQSFNRFYPDGTGVAHLLGYVGSPSEEMVEKERDRVLSLPGFKVGKQGVEKALDKRLRGEAGANRVEVDVRGRILRDLAKKEDRPGDTVVTSIDREIQAFAAQRMDGQAASAIVMGVETGEILTLASVPAFDPNSFSRGIKSAEWQGLLADERHPLINKPVQAMFPPGSTFKMLVAMAALESGLISPEDRVFCPGRYRLGSHFFYCHKRRGHGSVDMNSGLAQSCNVYFYHVGRTIGVERIADMARRFGLGQRFDLPVTSQKRGLVPDPAWKQKRFGKDWLTGETLNTAVGQGYLLATPLQLAVMVARLASGRAVVPQLIREGREPTPAPFMDVNQEHLALVREAMADVVNARGGTARGSRLSVGGFTMAGKTGTAQVRRITRAERARGVLKNEQLPWRMRDHGLFVAFAPVERPRYACAVVVEHGGSGSRAAAPIARDIMNLTLKRDPLAQRALIGRASEPADSAESA
jgi:penicillin-binding protein 2